MISFRSSVRPIVRPAVLSSVLQFECKFLSLMHVCLSVIFLISYFELRYLLSGGYACVRECAADVCTHMNSPFVRVFIRLTFFLYLTYMDMFKYFCPPVSRMPCFCVRPSIYLTAYMHAYVEVCASVYSSFHPFVCIHECFILACVRECLWAWV